MLDHVERRRFLVDPAREDPAPARIRLLHVDLDERPGQLLILPRGGGLARPQAHDEVVPARRLAGLQPDVADDPVALVEKAEDRDTVRHWRDARLLPGTVARALRTGTVRLLRTLILPAAAGQKEAEPSAH